MQFRCCAATVSRACATSQNTNNCLSKQDFLFEQRGAIFVSFKQRPEKGRFVLRKEGMKKLIFIGLFAIAVILPFQVHAYSQGTAEAYLTGHSNNPWSTIALSSLGVGNIPTNHLKNITSGSAIDYEAPILAIAALGENPHSFGGSDYVATLKSFYSAGQIGDPTGLNDDIFGILALISTDEPSTDPVLIASESFLLAHQNADGGWGFSTSATSDSNTTATAIVALRAFGLASTDTHIQNALSYLKTTQNNDGGFTYDPTSPFGTDSDSSSTAWAMWALTSTNANPSDWTKNGNAPTNYLEGNQDAGGFFTYQSGSGEDSFSAVTTAYAIIALSGKTLPLNKQAGSSGGGPATHDIIITMTGDGKGKVTSDDGKIMCDSNASTECTYAYDEGSKITLTAVPDSGSSFTDTWLGDCTGNDPKCVLTVDTEKHVTAHFTLSNPPPLPLPISPVNSPSLAQNLPIISPNSPPTGQILDAVTDTPNLPIPAVLGASTNLPRTGFPMEALLAIMLGGITVNLIGKYLITKQ